MSRTNFARSHLSRCSSALAVSLDEGRQVRRGEIADLLSVGVAYVDELDVALLRQVPVEQLLRDMLTQDRIEAPALRRGELPDLLFAGAGLAPHPHDKLPGPALGEVFLQRLEDPVPQRAPSPVRLRVAHTSS